MKRRSGTKKQPDPTFFVDRSLGEKKFPSILSEQGVNVQVHCAHFARDAPDHEWIREVGDRGWIALCKDEQIKRAPESLRAVLLGNTHLFAIVGKNRKAAAVAEIFLQARHKIVAATRKSDEGFVAFVYAGGRVVVKLTRKELRQPRRRKS